MTNGKSGSAKKGGAKTAEGKTSKNGVPKNAASAKDAAEKTDAPPAPTDSEQQYRFRSINKAEPVRIELRLTWPAGATAAYLLEWLPPGRPPMREFDVYQTVFDLAAGTPPMGVLLHLVAIDKEGIAKVAMRLVQGGKIVTDENGRHVEGGTVLRGEFLKDDGNLEPLPAPGNVVVTEIPAYHEAKLNIAIA